MQSFVPRSSAVVAIIDDDEVAISGDASHPIIVGDSNAGRPRGGRTNPIPVADEDGGHDDVQVINFKPGNAVGKLAVANSSSRGRKGVIFIGDEDDGVVVFDVYCRICMEGKYAFDCVKIKGCRHAYCASCVGLYVAAKVEANEVMIGCPEPTCKVGSLELEMCRYVVARQVFDKWGDRLCEEAIAAGSKFYCPFSDCSALVILESLEGGSLIRDSECPHCSRMFCAQCKVPWHEGVNCEMYQKLGKNDRGKDDLMLIKLAGNQQWQRCPKCGFVVERIEGCNYMRCRCGKTFCYKCAGPVRDKDHSCPKCKIWG